MSRRARATGGAPAGAPRASRSATARTRAPASSPVEFKAGAAGRSLVLHLQAHRQQADVRRQPQEALERQRSPNSPMPDLLLEFFSEEIPARMQARAAEDLKKLVTDRLVEAGLTYEGATAFATPRRLALAVQGVPVRQPDVQGGAQGPARRRAGEGDRGLSQGRRAHLDRAGQGAARQEGRLLRRGDREAGPAGDRRDRRDRAGRRQGIPLAEVDALGRSVGAARRARLGAAAAFDRRDLRSGDRGARGRAVRARRHRMPATPPTAIASWRPAPIKVRRFDDYVEKLEAAKVVVDPARRAAMILTDAKNLAFAQGLELVEDDGLLGRGRGPRRMAGGADGLVRRAVPVDPARGDPRHHPQQPEMLRAARSEDREARQQVHPGRQHRGGRRRRGDRRRQRAGDPRAALGRQVLLRDRPQDAAGGPAAEVRADRVPREARHAGGARSRASWRWRAISRRSSAPTSPRPSARRCSARPIS